MTAKIDVVSPVKSTEGEKVRWNIRELFNVQASTWETFDQDFRKKAEMNHPEGRLGAQDKDALLKRLPLFEGLLKGETI